MNRLAQELSPYLQQHRENPVEWFPWGEEAFAKAKAENKPIFLSIGYSTCYWCHVMEKDSFELPEVAEVLNKHFVAIKVDREERPEIDQIYMDAVVGLTGHGGWPMSVFLTPERKPFFGGTFFYRAQFIELCTKLAEMWSIRENDLSQSAEKITEYLKGLAEPPLGAVISPEILANAYDQLQSNFDAQFGGFGDAPKFPPSQSIRFLLRYGQRNAGNRATDLADYTLECMRRGGIYDQIGGGFHRYSVDRFWLVPHFEKMLYDNALLSLTYLEGYQALKKPEYLKTATLTLDYILREMTGPERGFLSAEDAGEVGKEGEFYVWTKGELQSLLSPSEYQALEVRFGITESGNFEHGTNVLHLPRSESLTESAETQRLSQLLLQARNKRTRPHLDDKSLTAWNALTITAFSKGYQITGRDEYRRAARDGIRFLRENLFTGTELLRRFRNGEGKFSGYLEDYSYLIQALLVSQENEEENSFAEWAILLQSIQDNLFWDKEAKGYFFSKESPELFLRKKEFNDNATPAANGIAAQNLLRLYRLTGEEKYKTRFEELLQAAAPYISRYPAGYGSFLLALDELYGSPQELVISTDTLTEELSSELRAIHQNFHPGLITALHSSKTLTPLRLQQGKEPSGSTLFFLCENRACKAPVSSLSKLSL